MTTRIGVDIGGTFTDLVFFDHHTARTIELKVPTTPDRPVEGCMNAIAKAVSEPALREAQYFLHGTTVGLNALIERRGAVVGLLATRGFRDVLELRRGDRDQLFNLFWKPAEPLVPRRRRLPVTERVRADGHVLVQINPDDIRHALEVFQRENVTSIAIAFLNSYVNPDHELAAQAVLRDAGFEGDISCSHRLSGEYREYERTSTTAIDAFVRGRMADHLERVETRLHARGFNGNMLVTRSGGGAMTFAEAQDRPFETVMSGPVAGALGAAELSKQWKLGELITADVGGTSFDSCLIIDGQPQLKYQGSIEGMPVQTPWVDVRSIGAGGGSVAWLDSGGLLRVGPLSAGAEPGPACYGQGGTEPTVTDAAFHLGMLGEGLLASGLKLDSAIAANALQTIGSKLGFETDETAQGILLIAAAGMANTMREILMEQGIDPRETKLFAFGGAGPLMCTLLAEELEVGGIIVPPFAGNFSAWGLLSADLARSSAQTKVMKLSDDCLPEVNRVLARLFGELESRVSGRSMKDVAATGTKTTRCKVGIDMRYLGQEHSLTIDVPGGGQTIDVNCADLRRAFETEYRRIYDVEIDEPIEIVTMRATIIDTLPTMPQGAQEATSGRDTAEVSVRRMEAYSFVESARISFAIIDHADLTIGRQLIGPAIIREKTSTIYLDSGFGAVMAKSGCLYIDRMNTDKS